MRRKPGLSSVVALVTAGMSGALYAQSGDAGGEGVETILITTQRDDRISRGATGLNLGIRETPQSISLVTADQMTRFGADSLNDALRLATGINVEEWETNRTNYMSRGFEIKNTQIDGVGLPNDWGIVTGAMDSFGYEKLEVIRGANGLLTGIGNASGTINYVRKRPTNTPQGSLEVSGGSYDFRRIEADYSTPFTADGAWAGRFVAAVEDRDSWVHGLTNDRTFVYGVIDGQIGERSTLAVGYSYQKANTDGNMWGGLVFSYEDGTQASFDRGATTSQDWTFWDTKNHAAFAEYTYALPRDWNLKLTYNYRDYEDDNKLFFAYTYTGLDKETGLGLSGNPGSWPTENDAHLADLTVDGKFALFGRSHEAIFGISYSTGTLTQYWRPVDDSDPSFGPLPPFPYPGNVVAEPPWGPVTEYSVLEQELGRFYGATRLWVTDRLAAILGFNYIDYRRKGHQLGESFDQTQSELSPYAGVTYSIRDNVLAYASYSDIYQPQDYYDIDGRLLDPTRGVNYEIGIKSEWLDNRLLATLAWFTAKQENLGTYAGQTDDGMYYYEGVDVDSKGVELEIVGRLNDYVDVSLGFTSLSLEGANGEDIYEWVPRRTVNLTLASKIPAYRAITVGLHGRWQSDISKVDEYTGSTVRQDSYAVINAFARWDVTDRMSVRANVANLTDQKYIGSLYQIGYYGAPRNYSVSVSYRF